MQVCTSLQTDNHASTSPLTFLQTGCPSCRPTNSVQAVIETHKHIYIEQKSKIKSRVHYAPQPSRVHTVQTWQLTAPLLPILISSARLAYWTSNSLWFHDMTQLLDRSRSTLNARISSSNALRSSSRVCAPIFTNNKNRKKVHNNYYYYTLSRTTSVSRWLYRQR